MDWGRLGAKSCQSCLGKIYDNTFKKSLRRKCSKVIFITIKICSASDIYFAVVELVPFRGGNQ